MTGAAEVDQVARQVAESAPQRADGGRGEVGPVSARDVRHHPRREPIGGRVRAHSRVLGDVLARHAPADEGRSAAQRAPAAGPDQCLRHVAPAPP